jgi:hypothetical protein
MTYKDALELASQKQYLVGRKWNGLNIDEIIICPSDPNLLEQYLRIYIDYGHNAKKAVLAYIHEDLEVGIFDKKRFFVDGVYFRCNVEEVNL